MEWTPDTGRKFHPLKTFQGNKLIPWKFNYDFQEENNPIYHIGNNVPAGYFGDYHNDIKFLPSDFVQSFKQRIQTFDRFFGLSLGGLIQNESEDYFFDRYDGFNDDFNEICRMIIQAVRRTKFLKYFIGGNYYMDDYYHTFHCIEFFEDIIEKLPNIEHLLLRGRFSGERSSGIIRTHSKLKSLTIQTFGLSNTYLNYLMCYFDFPNLTSLEIHLGTEFYHGVNDISGLDDLFAGKFPSLKHLSLLDSDVTDDIAYEIAHSSVIEKLDSLDLSFGTLTDEGATLLFNSPKIHSLQSLSLNSNDLSYRFIHEEIPNFKLKVKIYTSNQRSEPGDRFFMIRE